MLFELFEIYSISSFLLTVMMYCFGNSLGAKYNSERYYKALNELEFSCIEVSEKEEELKKITKDKFKCEKRFGHIHRACDMGIGDHESCDVK